MVLKLLTPEEVRKTTLKDFEDYVLHLAKRDIQSNILLSPFQGAGKSYSLMKTTAELAKIGKNILISVPTSRLAYEFKEWLHSEGVGAFVLASHRAIFSRQLVPFQCPSYEEIQESISLGVSSASFKEELCSGCPFFDKCYYPRQYSEVLEDRYNVVIIQHTHLQCQEVIYRLLEKRFDAFFIDESFLDVCYDSVQIQDQEIEILKSFRTPQLEKLYRWISREERSRGKLDIPEDQLKQVKRVFEQESVNWTVPDYIRYYNQGRSINPVSGIEIVYELPKIPIRVLADATPPQRLIEYLTGINNLVTFGKGEVLDVRRVNPKNAIIQLLDLSASKTSLSEGNNFELILNKVGELCELKYPNKKILFTTYKDDGVNDFTTKTKNYFKNNKEYPSVESRLTINHLSKGTNEFKDYDVQFLVCGVYFAGGDYKKLAYEYKTVANYYNHKYGRRQINNVFPYDLNRMCSINIHAEKTRRIQEEGIFEYDLDYYTPDDEMYKLIFDYNSGNTQQAIRVRPDNPEKETIIYILNNTNMPSMISTHNVMFRDFIQPIQDINKYW